MDAMILIPIVGFVAVMAIILKADNQPGSGNGSGRSDTVTNSTWLFSGGDSGGSCGGDGGGGSCGH